MRHSTRISMIIGCLAFLLNLGGQQLLAQSIFGNKISQASIKTLSASKSKASYQIEAWGQTVKLSLVQSGNFIRVNMENAKCSLGQAQIGMKGGKFTVKSRNLHKGTLGIWAFAISKIGVSGGKPALKPKGSIGGCSSKCFYDLGPVESWFWPINKIPGIPGGEDPPVCFPVKDKAHLIFDSKYAGALSCASQCK